MRFEHFEVDTGADGQPVELGRGAMGITYLATDLNLLCKVALKVVAPGLIGSASTKDRFLREARSAAALRHPNVATVLHFGSQEGTVFYAMEFVDGESAAARLGHIGKLPPAEAVEIGIQVCRALSAAAAAGIVHRDIKPSNIMLARDESDRHFVKVIDFGLAKPSALDAGDATLTVGGFVGTPHFASPEQLAEQPLDSRSDIYSLGVTLFHLLSGSPPFSGSIAQVMSAHLSTPPPLDSLSGIPAPLIDTLAAFLAKDPDSRPQSPDEARRLLEACREIPPHGAQLPPTSCENSGPGPVLSTVPDPTPPAAPTAHNRRALLLTSALIGAVVATGFFAWQFSSSKREAAPTESTAPPLPSVTPSPTPIASPSPPEDPVDRIVREAEAATDVSVRAKILADGLASYPQNPRIEALAAGLARALSDSPPDDWEPLTSSLPALAPFIDTETIEELATRIVKARPILAASLLESAASRGSTPARTRLAILLLTPPADLPADPSRALSLLKESASANDPRAVEILGTLTNRGIPDILPPDPAAAFALYQRAKQLGSLDANGYIGAMILEGRGTGLPPDPAGALSHFREGVAQGSPFSMFLLAQCLDLGTGTTRDPELAKLYFAAAARGGLKPALVWCEENNVDPYTTPHPPALIHSP